ncbi:hypothetical protein [Aeromonas allosaccharophila]
MKNADMPAMPLVNENGSPVHWSSAGMENVGVMAGLTKREMMAMAAMQGLLSKHGDDDYDSSSIARYAAGHADALLAELEKQDDQ